MTNKKYVAVCGIEDDRIVDNIDIDIGSGIKIRKIDASFFTSHGWSFQEERESQEKIVLPLKPYMVIGQNIRRKSNLELCIEDADETKITIANFIIKLVFCYTAFPFFIADKPIMVIKDANYNGTAIAYEGRFLSEQIPFGGFIYGPTIISDKTFCNYNINSICELYLCSDKYKMLVDTFLSVGFISDKSMIIVKIWSVLEKIFSSGSGEIRFRISIYLASYLCDNNHDRKEMQRKIAKLYDERSAAAHGRKAVSDQVLIDSFSILKSCIIKITTLGTVPTPENISNMVWD